jgi:hypothetical protein
MKLRETIAKLIQLNENVNSYPKLIDLAKQYDYETFLEKSDEITATYKILYRGMSEGDELSDNSFMAEFLSHAQGYGELVDGIVINDSVLYFDNAEFDKLRKKFIEVILPSFPKYFDNYEEYQEEIKEAFKKIYDQYFTNYKLTDAMYQLDYAEDKVIDFVYDFIVNSTEKYEKYSDKKVNDFFIPLLTYYAESKGYNILSFRGSDFYGADEFVVNDISRYTKLSDIWKSVN